MDADLDRMTREELVAEVKKLRHGIREHRDSSLHELCWHHPSLWKLLPDKTDSVAGGTRMAGVHARLREVSAVARCAGAQRSAEQRAVCKVI